MARIIVTHGSDANVWAQQFCRRASWTRGLRATEVRGMVVVPNVTRVSVVAALERAASLAGGGGEVIYSIGHGNGNASGANAQLGTGSDFTLTQRILSANAEGWIERQVDHCVQRVPLDPPDQLVNSSFRQIGQALTRAGVRRISFLTCVLGNNATFLRSMKVALGGGVEVAGYRGYVTTNSAVNQTTPGQGQDRIRLYLAYDQGGHNIIGGSETEPFCLLETPEARFSTVV